MNNKGFVTDAFLYIILIFGIAIGIIVVYVVFDQINAALADSPIDQEQKAYFEEQRDFFSSTWDYTFLTVLIAASLGLIGLAWLLQGNPVVFFALIVLVMIAAGVAGSLSNAFGTAIEDEVLGNSAANFSIITFVMDYYMIFAIVLIFVMLLVFFAKPGGGSF